MIIRIDENGNVFKTSLAKNVDETEFLNNNLDYKKVDFIFNPGIKYIYKNGKIIENTEQNEKDLIEKNKILFKQILAKTDFILAIDNPLNLTKDELNEVIEYRKKLRLSTNIIPIVPAILVNKGVL